MKFINFSSKEEEHQIEFHMLMFSETKQNQTAGGKKNEIFEVYQQSANLSSCHPRSPLCACRLCSVTFFTAKGSHKCYKSLSLGVRCWISHRLLSISQSLVEKAVSPHRGGCWMTARGHNLKMLCLGYQEDGGRMSSSISHGYPGTAYLLPDPHILGGMKPTQ